MDLKKLQNEVEKGVSVKRAEELIARIDKRLKELAEWAENTPFHKQWGLTFGVNFGHGQWYEYESLYDLRNELEGIINNNEGD